MSRLRTLTVTAVALGLMVGPSLAQTKPGMPAPAPQATAPATPAPAQGSEEWLRQRGESYHSAPESAQDPEEVATTAKLNAVIVDRNAEADALDQDQRNEHDRAQANYEADLVQSERARQQWEADNAAAQERYAREQAAYEAAVRSCERAGGRNCRSTGK